MGGIFSQPPRLKNHQVLKEELIQGVIGPPLTSHLDNRHSRVAQHIGITQKLQRRDTVLKGLGKEALTQDRIPSSSLTKFMANSSEMWIIRTTRGVTKICFDLVSLIIGILICITQNAVCFMCIF